MPSLYSENLRLRAAERADLPMFVRWISDPEVTEHLLMRLPMSFAEEEIWFEKMIQRPAAEHVYVIEIKLNVDPETFETEWMPVGTTSFQAIQPIDLNAEIGIMLGEKTFWNRGYGTETMKLMLRHGFNTLNLHRIWLQVYPANNRAIRSYEKAGFIQEGSFREGHYHHGVYSDVLIMSILKPEWELISQKEG